MFRFLRRLFSKGEPAAPEPRELAPPPPPPPRRIVTGDRSARPSRERRRLRLVHGGAAPTLEDPGLAAPSDEETQPVLPHPEPPQPAPPRPSVHLVFGDGTSEEVVESTPGGVRIRYLADNLLPGSEADDGPRDPSASS